MVWTRAPFEATTTISLLSPRARSNAIMSPEGDHTGLESFRPRSIGTSGRTNSGSMCSSACAAHAAAERTTTRRARTSSRVLDLVAIAARRLARLNESRIALELPREKVEVLAPRQARARHQRRLPGDQ